MKLLNKISTLMLAVVLAVGFTACDDTINDSMNDVKTSLEQEIDDLQNQVNKLESDLAAINSCTCTPHPNVDSIVAVQLMNFYTTVIEAKIESEFELNQLMARAAIISQMISNIVGEKVSFNLTLKQVVKIERKVEIPEIVNIIARTFKGTIVGGQ